MFGLLFFVGGALSVPSSGLLRVDVMNLRNDNGAVYCELFLSADGFPKKPEKAVAVVKADINDNSAACEFHNVLKGTYAVAAYHDENGNGRLDKNFLGIPKEGVGSSNDPKRSIGPPSFEQAKFSFDGEEKRIDLHMHY